MSIINLLNINFENKYSVTNYPSFLNYLSSSCKWAMEQVLSFGYLTMSFKETSHEKICEKTALQKHLCSRNILVHSLEDSGC